MKESTWKECIESVSAREISPDIAKARSLVATANARIRFANAKKLDQESAPFVFEAYYSSALEMLHAYVIMQGFKVANHICLGYYLRDVLKNEALFRIFDDCRSKRNALVYYGKEMDFEVAKRSINKMEMFKKEIGLELERLLK